MKIPEKLKKYEEYLKSTEKPAVEISFKCAETLPWESKVGGCPYLEKAEDYPRGSDGRPMMFLAQINLDDMPPLDDFPKHGLLQFYIGDDDYFGLDSACKVIYIPEYKKEPGGLLKINPFEEEYIGYTPYSDEGKMRFKKTSMLIGTESETFYDKFRNKVTDDEWDELYDLCYPDGCHIGGYPLFVQNPLPCYDDGELDVVLLQLDCEDECGIMFGDSGNCVFLISKEDLKNKNFDNVVYDWQCC